MSIDINRPMCTECGKNPCAKRSAKQGGYQTRCNACCSKAWRKKKPSVQLVSVQQVVSVKVVKEPLVKKPLIRPTCTECNKNPCIKRSRSRGYEKLCSTCYGRKYRKPGTSERHHRTEAGKRRVALQPCEMCGFQPVHICQMDIDHIDENHSNNEENNLMLLCSNCHRLKSWQHRCK